MHKKCLLVNWNCKLRDFLALNTKKIERYKQNWLNILKKKFVHVFFWSNGCIKRCFHYILGTPGLQLRLTPDWILQVLLSFWRYEHRNNWTLPTQLIKNFEKKIVHVFFWSNGCIKRCLITTYEPQDSKVDTRLDSSSTAVVLKTWTPKKLNVTNKTD